MVQREGEGANDWSKEKERALVIGSKEKERALAKMENSEAVSIIHFVRRALTLRMLAST